MSEHSRSISPPPPRPEPAPSRSASHASLPAVSLTLPEVAEQAARGVRRADRALALLGAAPSPVTGDDGSGVLRTLALILARMDALDATMGKFLARLDAAEGSARTRGGWLAARGERVLDALLVAAFLGLAAAALRRLGIW